MVQVIEQAPGLGAILGQSVGQGLSGGISAGLEMLAQQKMEGMRRQNAIQALQGLGLPAELSALEPSVQKEYLSQLGKQRQMETLRSLLGGGGQLEEAGMVSQGPGGEISDEAIVAVSQIDPGAARILQAQKESKQRQTQAAFKETKDFRKEVREESKAARENVARLNRMAELVDEGKLTNPLLYSTLQKFGLDVPVLLSPDSQEFQKLTVDFLRDARQIFGARVTNYEAQQFLKSIPSLLQTEEGKKRVIRNLKTLAKGAELRAKETNKVIRENRGAPPLDLAERVEERIDPKLSQLYEQFASGIGPEEAEEVEMVRIVLPDGRKGSIPRSNLKQALKRGAKRG